MNRLLQVVIALVGIAITGVLGFATQRSDALQTRHMLLGNFTEAVSAARASCDGDLMFMALGTLDELERQEARERLFQTPADAQDQVATRELIRNYRDRVAEMQTEIDTGACSGAAAATVVASTTAPTTTAPAPGATGPAAGAATRSLTVPQLRLPAADAVKSIANSELRRAEQSASRVSRMAPNLAASEGYYVVLGSYDANARTTYGGASSVVTDYRKFKAAISESDAKIEVFRTSLSNHFVIALAPRDLDRDAARELVSTARARGWSTDAFVQARRGWTPCPDPEAIDGPNACGGAPTIRK